MPTRILKAEPISQEAFAPFGNLIGAYGEIITINEGTTDRYHKQAEVEALADGQAIINMFRAQARTFPLNIKMMERHPLGSQAFLPQDSQPYLVLVGLGETQPDPESLKLFYVQGEGVNYQAGCWHFPLLSLDQQGASRDFWVVDRAGAGNNLEESYFSEDWDIRIEAPHLQSHNQAAES